MTSFAEHTLADFIAALAAPTPAPGGGAAAAVSGATA
ncbi:MAG: cyclodeaminase/cyclohydrolase family protein, partial [Candidatus Limnocylindrus sp.]